MCWVVAAAWVCGWGAEVWASCRFEKNDILRIVRALAIFRPSLIALQMPLSEEDEVFVEKCFQRSLIVRLKLPIRHGICLILRPQELDKLVSFSGTPTVAWRRTGEICLVGPEFCMLTGWEKEELVGRRKYIYEVRLSPSRALRRSTDARTAVRKPVRGGVLGELREPRV